MPPGSATVQAIDYNLKRWAELTRFVGDSDVPISTNWVEDQIRPIAIERSNWLFAGNLRAGQRAVVAMSLLQSARINGHDPYAYFKNVLERLPTDSSLGPDVKGGITGRLPSCFAGPRSSTGVAADALLTQRAETALARWQVVTDAPSQTHGSIVAGQSVAGKLGSSGLLQRRRQYRCYSACIASEQHRCIALCASPSQRHNAGAIAAG